MTKKVHILKETSDETLYSLGIISSDSIFQLSMNLNNYFNYSFKLSSPVNDTKNNDFPCCLNEQEDLFKCYLIKNKHNSYTLFSSYAQIDFILVFIGDDSLNQFNRFLNSFRSVENISAIVKLESKKLKILKKLRPLIN